MFYICRRKTIRIIGGRDYYDGVQAVGGYDSSIVFDRSKQWNVCSKDPKVPINSGSGLTLASSRSGHTVYDWADTFCVIFAGKIYYGARVKILRGNIDLIVWNHHKLIEVADKHDCDIYYRSRLWNAEYLPIERLGKPIDPKPEQLKWIIDNKVVVGSSFCQMDVQYKIDTKTLWQFNGPMLSQLGFASVIDPYQAYQQLAQFISNDLATEPDKMVKITDEKILVNKHGFDKHSFRKLPQKG